MIRNLVFDYGGVIVNVYDSMIKKAFLDLDVSILKQIIHRRKIKRLMNEFIDGIRPTEDTVDEIHSLCGNKVTRRQLDGVLSLLAGELPEQRLERLCRLRKKYKVYMLSNINDLLWENSVKQINDAGYKVEDCFDDTFLSFRMGTAKPGEDIYRMMIDATHLVPGETMYFDDRKDNIITGLRLGFIASHVASNRLEENTAFAGL